MDKFTPEWLEFKSQPIKNPDKKVKVETIIEKDKFTKPFNVNIMEEIKKNGLRPQYNSKNQNNFKMPINIPNKNKKQKENKKKENKKSNEDDDSYNIYSDVNNFVERYYFAPRVKNNPEIYISSSEDEFSDDIDEINYN